MSDPYRNAEGPPLLPCQHCNEDREHTIVSMDGDFTVVYVCRDCGHRTDPDLAPKLVLWGLALLWICFAFFAHLMRSYP